jgi:guanine deaminase
MNDQHFLRLAIEKAQEGIAIGQSPFGAVIIRDGVTIAAAHNTVWRDCDPTAHAEINAIRAAAAALKTIDLSGSTMFTTCEPCPMCLAAIHWSKIDRVVYGATIADAAGAGFTELRVGAASLAELGGSQLIVEPAASPADCSRLFSDWAARGLGRSY